MKYTKKFNVADVKNDSGLWLKSYCLDGVLNETRAGKLWHGLNNRCNAASAAVRRKPRYAGCENHFKDFQEFAEWCQVQVGYKSLDEYGALFHIDKDLLVMDNKIYSPTKCVFLPVVLNSLLVKSNKTRGEWPIGVHNSGGKFIAQCQSGSGTQVYLGVHKTPVDAFEAYKEFKESFIKQQANKYRGVIDPRAYKALMQYVVKITD